MPVGEVDDPVGAGGCRAQHLEIIERPQTRGGTDAHQCRGRRRRSGQPHNLVTRRDQFGDDS